MLFYKSEYLEIDYDANHKLVETRLLQFAPSMEYREGLNQYLEILKGHQVKLWLGDYRLGKVIRLEDQEWAARTWFPTFLPLATGIERMARVRSEDVFNQVSSENMKEKIDIQGLPFLFSEFKYYEDAKTWLLQKNSSSLEKPTHMLG